MNQSIFVDQTPPTQTWSPISTSQTTPTSARPQAPFRPQSPPTPSHLPRVTSPLRRVASPIGTRVSTPTQAFCFQPVVETEEDEAGPDFRTASPPPTPRCQSPLRRPQSPLPDPRLRRRPHPLRLSIGGPNVCSPEPSPIESPISPILFALEESQRLLAERQSKFEEADVQRRALVSSKLF